MKKGIVTLIGVAGLATVATAQTGGTFLIKVSNDVKPGTAFTMVEIWATWSGGDHVFGASNYDLNASSAGWSATTLNLGVEPPNKVGVINGTGTSIIGATIGQVHLPSLQIFGNPDNPILLATYRWETTDFTARTVKLGTTNTLKFLLSDRETGRTTDLFPNDFKDGAGSFIVTPAPSALALLGLGGLVATRRRR